jgi:hypothetical protein
MLRFVGLVLVVAESAAATVSTTVEPTAITATVVAAAVSATVTTAATAAAAVAAAITAAATAVTTTVAATATVSTTTTATAEAGAIAFGTRTSLVHDQVAAVEAFAVGAFDGSTAGVVIGHFNEPEATATVRYLVHDDLGRCDLSERSEKLVEILVLY